MHIKAYAKINPVLDIVGILPNGYHEIDTVMQKISLYDDVYVEKTDSGIILNCSEKYDGTNIGETAVNKFFEHTGINGGAKIEIVKNIPSAAGLGGGSSDAAAVLYALNELYDNPLNNEQLLNIAVKLGADVPFFLYSSTARAKGIGEILSEVETPEYYCVIFKGATKNATGSMYGAYDKSENKTHPNVSEFIEAFVSKDINAMNSSGGNSFDCLWDFEKIYAEIYSLGADYCGLTGSGPTIFGLFNDHEKAQICADHLSEDGIVFVTEFVKTV